MKSSFSLLFLSASLLPSLVFSKLTYSVHMTHNSSPIPVVTTPFFARSVSHRKASSSSRAKKRDSIIDYSTNWAGAHQDGAFYSISGTWEVPAISVPDGETAGSTPYWLYQWVGIDGVDCGNLLQAGTGSSLDSDGGANYVWWEWYPEGPQEISMPINTGDSFFVNVTATTANSGIILIENLTQGYGFKVTMTNSQTLCLETAEWIVENPGTLASPNFTDVYFTDCLAVTDAGVEFNLDGVTYDFMENGGVEVEAEEVSAEKLRVWY